MASLAPDLQVLSAMWGPVQAEQQLLVSCGLRPACRLRVSRERLGAMAETAGSLSLAMIVGSESIHAEMAPGRSGFSEWGQRLSLTPHTRGDCYVYLSPSHIYGQRLRRHDEVRNDAAVGEMLGYPPCCVEVFSEKAKKNKGDPVLWNYSDRADIKWMMNVSLLAFGHALLNHVPCSVDCAPSSIMASQNYDFVLRTDAARASELKAILSSMVLHTEMLGVAAFKATEKEQGLRVNEVCVIDQASILGKLVHTGSMIRRERDGIELDGCLLAGSEVRLFRFI